MRLARRQALPLLAAVAGLPFLPAGVPSRMDQPFTIRFAPAMRDDLRRRLSATRWSDAVSDDWDYGTSPPFLRALCERWRDDYDFDAAEARLNAWPQFHAVIDGFRVHYRILRAPRRPPAGPTPIPLLLLNGWPSSFVEYERLAPMLADPAAHGADPAPAFDVVMPTLPGYGFSDRPTRPNQVLAEQLFHRLMVEHLGYDRYLASGTDIGAGVATRLALTYPDAVRGIHLAAVKDPTLDAASAPLTAAERQYLADAAAWEAAEGGYEHEHYTKPQTLAFALADSPVGLASWIVEKYHGWSDHGPFLLDTFPADMLLDTLTIYWSTGTIGSSIRYYRDDVRYRPPLAPGTRVAPPAAICVWPHDLARPPREWAERLYDVHQYAVQPRGGHFPAWEQPNLYAADLRRFADRLRAGTRTGSAAPSLSRA